MSLANTTTYADYNCDGTNKVFAIPFDTFSDDQIEAYLYDPVAGTYVLLIQGGDYVVTPPLTVGDRPIEIETTDPYPVGNIIRVQRSTTLQQVIHYINNSGFLATDHEKGLDRIVMMIQEISQQLGYALKLSTVDGILNVNPGLPPLQDNSVLVYNATTKEFESVLVVDLLAELAGAGGLPPGGDEFSILEKSSSTQSDTRWTDPITAIGYSARYNQNVNLEGTKALLDFIFNIQYQGPGVAFTASSVANSLREKGTSVTATTLQAAITKNSLPVTEVRFYRNPSTLLDTQTSGGGIPNGGNSTYAWTGSFSDDTVFRVEVTDGTTTETRTLTFPFVYPYYTGVGAAGLGAGVSALTKLVINSTASLNRSFTVNGSQKMYFAYPASYGALTSVLDVNNFNTLPDWTLTTTNITGLDGNPVSYRIYEFNNFAVAGTYSYTFVR